jgi:hypothetical protein
MLSDLTEDFIRILNIYYRMQINLNAENQNI